MRRVIVNEFMSLLARVGRWDAMARLVYAALASLDGFVADEHGRFDWAEPDAEVHAFVNDLERSLGTYLYGRRTYEVMVCWETLDLADEPPHHPRLRRVWRDADKIVYSRTLPLGLERERTQLEREFDPDAVRQPEGVRGPRPRRSAAPDSRPTPSRPGWSTRCTCSCCRTWWGAGRGCSPTASASALELLDERRFGNGTVHVRYRVGS